MAKPSTLRPRIEPEIAVDREGQFRSGSKADFLGSRQHVREGPETDLFAVRRWLRV